MIDDWKGLNTSIEDTDDLLPGSAINTLNWVTSAGLKDGHYMGDHIELRRGTAFLQTNAIDSVTPVSGMTVGIRPDGTQIPFWTAGRKLYYFNPITGLNTEIGTDFLPVGAINDQVSLVSYQNLSGYHVIMSSPNSSIYKIVVATPTNVIDFQSYDLRGNIAMDVGRTFLWNRQGLTGKDLVNLYVSYADAANYSVSPPITAKTKVVGPATDGIAKTFTGTLAIDNTYMNVFGIQIVAPIATPVNITAITKEATPTLTANSHGLVSGDVFYITGVAGMTEINNLIGYVVSVKDVNNVLISINTSTFTAYTSGGTIAKSEQLTDDQNGNLKSIPGGTGTVNYVSGAYSATFNTVPVTGGNLIISFYEDQSNNNSFAKFLLTAPANAGDGDFLQQQGFGNMQSVIPMSGLYFCFHQYGTYQLSIDSNDVTKATQAVYRKNLGIPFFRGAYPTSEGIIYLDTLTGALPKLRILDPSSGTSAVNPAILPKSLSDFLDLTMNDFSQVVVYEWGDYYILECKGFTNGTADTNNNVMYVMNKKTGYYDKHDYRATCFANYYGALLSGDSISPNPLVLFSGFDDLGFKIVNNWDSAPTDLGKEGMKRFNRLVIKGLMSITQNLDIYLSFDNSLYTKVATVQGNGQFVNTGIPHEVGGMTMGSNVVGGGGTITAYPYEAEFSIGSDLFNRVSFRVVATDVGYVSVEDVTFKDIRHKSSRIMANLSQ